MRLLGELCIKLGFCSLDDASKRRLNTTPLSIDEFTDTVITGECGAEGSPLRPRIREIVASYYACDAER